MSHSVIDILIPLLASLDCWTEPKTKLMKKSYKEKLISEQHRLWVLREGSFRLWINVWVAGRTVWFLVNMCHSGRFRCELLWKGAIRMFRLLLLCESPHKRLLLLYQVLFRYAVAILKYMDTALMSTSSSGDLNNHMRYIGDSLHDADRLAQVTFCQIDCLIFSFMLVNFYSSYARKR